jgi:hypothetical protein
MVWCKFQKHTICNNLNWKLDCILHFNPQLHYTQPSPFMVGVPKMEKKKLMDFLELLFTNNIYMKQI